LILDRLHNISKPEGVKGGKVWNIKMNNIRNIMGRGISKHEDCISTLTRILVTF
jgi:hypothetical protein